MKSVRRVRNDVVVWTRGRVTTVKEIAHAFLGKVYRGEVNVDEIVL